MALTSTELRKLNGAARVPSISTSDRLWPKLRSSSTCAPNASLPCEPWRTPPDSCGILVEKSSIVSADCSLICSSPVDATGLLLVRPGIAIRVPVTTMSSPVTGTLGSAAAGAVCACATPGTCARAMARAATATVCRYDVTMMESLP